MFDVKDTFDLLKGLLNILSEYEQVKDDPLDKSKIVCSTFRSPVFFFFLLLTLGFVSGYFEQNSIRSMDLARTPSRTLIRQNPHI